MKFRYVSHKEIEDESIVWLEGDNVAWAMDMSIDDITDITLISLPDSIIAFNWR